MFRRFSIGIIFALAAISSASAQSTFSVATWTGVWSLSGPHTLVGYSATQDAAAGAYVIVLDSASVPGSGSTLASAPARCDYIGPVVSPARSSEIGMANTPNPVVTLNGIQILLSSTPCNVSGAVYTPMAGHITAIWQ